MSYSTELIDIDVLSTITRQKLLEYGLLLSDEKITLCPHHRIILHGVQHSHYIIICEHTNRKFFLKTLKEKDNALYCDNVLKKFRDDNGEYIYPTILVPVFNFNNTQYYITTFINGQTLDDVSETLTETQWENIAVKLRVHLERLSTLHAPFYSEHNGDQSDDYASIQKAKFLKRLEHPLFLNYSHTELEKALLYCFQILETSQYSKPTFLHMDIKPANIIYNPQNDFVTLIDFEFARFGDLDYGWTQVLLSGLNWFIPKYKKYIVPQLIKGHMTLEEAVNTPKLQCYLFYQIACNLIYYNDLNRDCPEVMKKIFVKLLHTFSKEV